MRRASHSMLMIIAAIAAAALLVVGFVSPRLAAAGWLIAFVVVSAIPLGSLAWLMIARLTGGHWAECLRPVFEPAAVRIPLLAILFVPVLFALPLLYPWVADSSVVKPDVAALYLNIPLFILRAGVAFAGWGAIALVLQRLSGRGGILLAATGLVFHTVMMTLLSIDWILSAEPAFISTSFGATIVVTQMLAALAFAALFAPGLDDGTVRDLGGLLLTLTLGVTYLNFMAVLVIWYGDLPAKVFWFVERVREPWNALAVAAFVVGSVVPILMLLLRRVRASRSALRAVACSSLAGIALYDAWLLAPTFGVWALGTAALATIAMSSASIVIVRADWLSRLFVRARTVS